MTVAPPTKEVPAKVPVLISGLAKILLVNVAVPASVTMTPVVGKVALELTPVPPELVAKVPVTAADCDRSRAPNDGVPPVAGTRKLW